MIFFAKKDRKREEEIEKIKDLVAGTEGKQEAGIMQAVSEAQPSEELPKPKPKPRKEPTAPLFVKIEKYHTVLDIITGLKTTLIMAKNALAIQRELHRLTIENMGLVQSAVDKVNQKMGEMDTAFMRPKGYEEEDLHEAEYEPEELEDVVSDLRDQIKDLKDDLKSIE